MRMTLKRVIGKHQISKLTLGINVTKERFFLLERIRHFTICHNNYAFTVIEKNLTGTSSGDKFTNK